MTINPWLDFNVVATPYNDIDADRLRAALLDRLEEVLCWLFPRGRIVRRQFRVGNLQGDPGQSLVVELDGERRGCWYDHATGLGGDILSAWSEVRHIALPEEFPILLNDAQEWLGNPPANRRRTAAPASAPLGRQSHSWSYVDGNGVLLALVRRYDLPGGGKSFRPFDVRHGKMAMPPIRPLYNQPGIAQSQTVVLVEGEKCADALIALGICATTAMGGANAPTAKTDWTPLAGKDVLIWPDLDEPGRHYAEAAAHAILAAGASAVTLLNPPTHKPKGWDAADAIAEGFDVVGFIQAGERCPVDPPLEHAPPADLFMDLDPTTEHGMACAFTRFYHADWRYCATWGRWLVWNGMRWNPDHALYVQHLARSVCFAASAYADTASLRRKLTCAATSFAVERFARSDPQHVVLADRWDRDVWSLNTPAGIVNLKTGTLSVHDREALITKIATATPNGTCPTWQAFIGDVTGGDADLAAYLARVAGYCLTGSTEEHALFFLFGTGANGKSVFTQVLASLLGDYSAHAPMDTFMDVRGDRHPTDLAGLRGARIVCSIETEQGRRWNEAKVKAITGGDVISARFMRQDFFEYVPQFKLVIAGNHKPSLRNVDEAMKRRLHLIPFTVTIPEHKRDHRLTEKLLRERDGILAWAVAGCLDWQRHGLQPPACVRAATAEYFEDEDAVGEFLEQEAQLHRTARVAIADLFQRWQEWAGQRGEYIGNSRWLSQQLDNRGFVRTRMHGGLKAFEGLNLRPRTKPHSLPYADD